MTPAELLLKIGCGLWIVGKFSTFGEVRTRTISSLPPSFGLVPLVYSDTRSSYGALDFGDDLSLVGFVLARGLYGVGAFGGHGCRIFAVFPGRKIAAVEVQDGIFVFFAYLPYFFRRYSVVLPYWRSDKGTLLP